MLPKDYLRWYSRSALGIGAIFAGAAAVAGAFAAGIPALLSILAGPLLVVAAGFAALVTGLGPKAAVAASEAARARDAAARISLARAARDRLSRMRIADGEVSRAAELVVLGAGEYLDACGREGSDDPLADAALDEALEIVDIFLKEKDEASTEKRYGLEDADPFADSRARVVAALKEKAAFLRERRIQIDGGLPAEGRMSVREELR